MVKKTAKTQASWGGGRTMMSENAKRNRGRCEGEEQQENAVRRKNGGHEKEIQGHMEKHRKNVHGMRIQSTVTQLGQRK